MQKSAWVASLDLLGRSDPRLFVREIEKRSSDLCKRMQVASAAAATHRCDQLWRRVKIAVPGAAVVSRPFSLLPFDVFVPRFPFFPNLSTPLSLSLSPSFRFIRRRASSFRKLRDMGGKRRNGRSPMMFMNERSCDCAPSNWLPKVVHGFEGYFLSLSLSNLVSKIAFDWISRGIPWLVCFFWMKYPRPGNRLIFQEIVETNRSLIQIILIYKPTIFLS